MLSAIATEDSHILRPFNARKSTSWIRSEYSRSSAPGIMRIAETNPLITLTEKCCRKTLMEISKNRRAIPDL